jgi:hypothetical protein
LNARPLSKHDYNAYRNLFALYLDVQKQLILEELSEREAKGRWKSFFGKWYIYLRLNAHASRNLGSVLHERRE